ncbi:carbohydrate ABC transporter permease [Gynuella sp.]|uniref:carbohydrate ABC transporter permease n=1 Tax=Gynuella sp. TaxID=2969146 RepID=UPI003D14704C
MNKSTSLGPFMLLPALLFVALFFLLPVIMTAIFSFTTMSTATGISGGRYQISPASLRVLAGDYQLPELARQLGQQRYHIDEFGLNILQARHEKTELIEEIQQKLSGQTFTQRRDIERALRQLNHRPHNVRKIKDIARAFQHTVGAESFDSPDALLKAIQDSGVTLTESEQQAVIKSSYTGWHWSVENYRRMVSLPDTATTLFNTLIYVLFTLMLFNLGFALCLALTTHYLPPRSGAFFRGLWLLPRISPPVLYVLLWKWVAWDTGFLSTLLANFDIAPRNWMLNSATSAWVFIILINGFVGASMGMLIFSSAIKAIPQTQFWASDVDGASRWQQIRYIILPQLRWPILFITCYQTLSLLASFDLILLATDGGPGGTTEVWSLKAYHTALNNYAGNLQYGYGAALAMVLVAIGLVLSLLYLRVFKFDRLVSKPRIEI